MQLFQVGNLAICVHAEERPVTDDTCHRDAIILRLAVVSWKFCNMHLHLINQGSRRMKRCSDARQKVRLGRVCAACPPRTPPRLPLTHLQNVSRPTQPVMSLCMHSGSLSPLLQGWTRCSVFAVGLSGKLHQMFPTCQLFKPLFRESTLPSLPLAQFIDHANTHLHPDLSCIGRSGAACSRPGGRQLQS